MADTVLFTLFRLHLRYRERAIEDVAAKSAHRSGPEGWHTLVADYVRSPAGRTDAARALQRAGFVTSDFFADDVRTPAMRLVCEFVADGPMRQFWVDMDADVSATFAVAVGGDKRLRSIEFNPDAMWPAFRRTLRPAAFERLGAAH